MAGRNGQDGSGNTLPTRRANKWCFTMYNYDMDVMDKLLSNYGKFIIGEEICPQTKNKHLQGYINFDKRLRFNQVKQILGNETHIEAVRGTEDDNIKYCMKDGCYKTNIKILKENKPKKPELWQDWQYELEKQHTENEPDNRSIYWYYDCCGNTGKTSFVKYMLMTYENECIVINKGKYSDMMNQIYSCEMKYCRTVMVDIPRSMREVSYGALESIKDGIITNSKYETGVKVIGNQNVFIFCNYNPCLEEFSKDRYIVKKLCNCD